ncbi:hypothetical protein [Fibrobacter sp.]|uniref:hypothetical protein n=1 Tax=Fibrobacter sp. TaxID=35828 RepID=UPI0025BD780D|nr:hypothetical protein [Fibrobacter sp.]MBR3073525.1 hypothetical protein [Fibrobacter sp.]
MSTINLDVSKDVLSIDSFPEINIKDYGFASFITPNSKNEMDTLTIPLDSSSKALSDTIVSSYKLSPKGLPAGIDLKYVLHFSEQNVTDPCAVPIEYPHLNKFSYQLQKIDDARVVMDSTIFWTLIYTDQYGISDSLVMKTRFH